MRACEIVSAAEREKDALRTLAMALTEALRFMDFRCITGLCELGLPDPSLS